MQNDNETHIRLHPNIRLIKATSKTLPSATPWTLRIVNFFVVCMVKTIHRHARLLRSEIYLSQTRQKNPNDSHPHKSDCMLP